MLCYTSPRKSMPKVNKENVLDNIKRFARKKALVICYLKHVLVFEEHSSEDYLKVISDGKKRPKDPHSVFPLWKDFHVITMTLLVDEV